MTVSFRPQNYTVEEGVSARLMVVLDKKATAPITVRVTTIAITAQPSTDTALRDYIAEYGTPLTFGTGVTKKELSVVTLLDTEFENDEHIKATLELDQAGTSVQTQIGLDAAYIAIFDRTGECDVM